ncbi:MULTISPECIES: hypothetical protein [Azospira]|jgi:hypothetical protein|uniref:Lipoprotein n=2 Tax=Azospira oryzae TaxID=146939 RepID=G8QHP8_AZOOP|nr:MULTISPECIES: hypothetical protein [Azospira]AEV25199.1 hypothetical protein Dsui_0792 [Azospira oryzae PS]MDK9691273.1 hypothetical protein [Azospira sp.]RZT76465.1 hypothetical protein EV678_2342 [Azospira oryzae]BBN89324.1 hypothetical protein AZSP09_23470 [Azospira sp. I09]
MKNKQVALLVAVAAVSLTTGCSTITQSENQRVSVTASYEGKPVPDADCSLSNDKGTWTAKAPGQVDVRKSGENLNVVCKKEGLVDGLLTAVSRAAGSMWGNIVFGGGIGAIIDHNKGTGYDYPTTLPVEMGKSVSVDRAQEKQQQQLQQQAAADCRNNGSTC